MKIALTLIVLAIWLWIGMYGLLASRKKNQKLITFTWAILIVVIAAYIMSSLFI